MHIARLFMLALAIVPAAAHAQPRTDNFAAIGKWIDGFTAATAEPTAATNSCVPVFQAILIKSRDAASARAASKEFRPCAEKIRAAYRLANEKLAAIEPLPAAVEQTASFDTRRFIDDQRKTMQAGDAYVGDLNSLVDAIASGNRPLADRLAVKVKQGAGVFVDANILQLKLHQNVARLDLVRSGLELRIIMLEAGKLLATGEGKSHPGKLSGLAIRADAATAASKSGWEADKARLTAIAGGQSNSQLDATISAIGPFADAAAQYGSQLSRALARAGAGPVLSRSDMLTLAAELARLEAVMVKAGHQYAIALQRIG